MTARVLVAGIGNMFFGDDGFGVEVARRLAERGVPAGVDVMDAGIRGFDLAFALLDGYDAAILVDTTSRGGAPGTLYVIEPDSIAGGGRNLAVDTHAMTPDKVLALVRTLGGIPPRLYVVGCEPASFAAGEDVTVGLSSLVAAAVDGAMALVDSLLGTITSAEVGQRA
jgi:hydrogenase maturation protease